MYRNPFWLIFLGIIGIATLGYSINTLSKAYDYIRLDISTPIHSIEWSVDPIDGEDFAIKAKYAYVVKNTLYEGNDTRDEHYLNALTAQENISRLSKTTNTIWIDSAEPSFSALQSHFPFQQSISTLFLWTIWIYFFWLGHYVKSYMQANKIH